MKIKSFHVVFIHCIVHPNLIMSYSIIVGLNPALQKRFILSQSTPSLVPSNVHRASAVHTGVGGKGQDVAITMTCICKNNMASTIHLMQFMGGDASGDTAMSKLESYQSNKSIIDLDTLTVRCCTPLRTCTTIIGKNGATELVEPTGSIHDFEIESMHVKLNQLLMKDGMERSFRGLCIMGSMPPGCPPNYYAQICDQIAQTVGTKNNYSYKCLIDSVVGLKHLLKQMEDSGVLFETMLKINYGELCKLANIDTMIDAQKASDNDILFAIEKLFDVFDNIDRAVKYISVTNGKYHAYFVDIDKMNEEGRWLYKLEGFDVSSDDEIYPIGAGDSVAAGTFAVWCNNPLKDELDDMLYANRDSFCGALNAFRFGLACGSASCLHEENSVVDINDVIQILSRIKVEEVEIKNL